MVDLVPSWKVLESLLKLVIVLRQDKMVVKQLVVPRAVIGSIKLFLLVPTIVPQQIQYVNVDGTTIANSSSIIRGFKPGYTITDTAGRRNTNGVNGGNGGAGSQGGDGGSFGYGGGGGSGYSSGVQVNSTSLGGGTGISKIEFSSVGGLYIDDEGRILIFSTDNRFPVTGITQTTGKVLPGSNTCLDDGTDGWHIKHSSRLVTGESMEDIMDFQTQLERLLVTWI